MDPSERSGIIRDSLGVGIATGTYGISFGAVAVGAGLSVAQTCALSLLMFTGASQFALVGVLAAGGTPLSGAPDRAPPGHPQHALRPSPRSAPRLVGGPPHGRCPPGHRRVHRDVGDPYVDPGRPRRVPDHRESRSSSCGTWRPWSARSAGARSGTPATYGLDAAVGAAFLALLWPRLRDRRNRVTALAAAAVALGLVPVTAAGVPVLASAGVALLIGVLWPGPDETEWPEVDR